MASGPLWPLLAISGAGWALMLAMAPEQKLIPICSVNGSTGWPDSQALLPAAMLGGMMAPLLAQNVTWVSTMSFASRRRRAIALFLAGYTCGWMGALGVLWVVANGFRALLGSETAALFAALGLCLVWQGSPAKPAALRLCHRTPTLPAFGLRAEVASLRYGLISAGWCVAGCWAMMLIPLAMPSAHFWLMAAVFPFMLGERYTRPPALRFRLSLVGAGSAALAAAASFLMQPG